MTQRYFTGLMTKVLGCTVDRYSCTFAGETKKRTFTTYEDSMGRIVAEIERIEGEEMAKVNFHPAYLAKVNEIFGFYQGYQLS